MDDPTLTELLDLADKAEQAAYAMGAALRRLQRVTEGEAVYPRCVQVRAFNVTPGDYVKRPRGASFDFLQVATIEILPTGARWFHSKGHPNFPGDETSGPWSKGARVEVADSKEAARNWNLNDADHDRADHVYEQEQHPETAA